MPRKMDAEKQQLAGLYYEALELALDDAGSDGLDVAEFTLGWVEQNEATCGKVARALYAEALTARGRKHVKRPLGRQLGLPGLEHLGDAVPAGLSVPGVGGSRYVAIIRCKIGQAVSAHERLVDGILADQGSADALLSLIRRRQLQGARDGELLLPGAPAIGPVVAPNEKRDGPTA